MKKIISSKYLTTALLVISIILSMSYTITGAVTFEQHLMFLFGVAIMVLILVAICHFIVKKDLIYSLNLSIIIYWLIYFIRYIFS